MFVNRPAGALGTLRFQELYPNYPSPGVDVQTPTSAAAASGGSRAIGSAAIAPTHVLIAVVVVLVAVRVLWEMAPEGSKGL